MSALTKQPVAQDELLTVDDAARILNVGKSSIYRLVQHRIIKHFNLRSGLRFARNHLNEYIDGCFVDAINEQTYGNTKNP